MPDWCEIARQGLGPLPFEADREDEIILELADHLEDLYSDAVRQGKSEAEAVQSALSAAADWGELRRAIQLASKEEDVMNYRVKTLWLPGAFAIALSGIVLRLFQIPTAPSPHIFWAQAGLVVYWGWLLCLPVIGALVAYWSRHVGGRLMEMALAVSLPALGMVGLPLLVFPFVLIYNLIRFHRFPFVPMAILLFGWGVLPEVALLVGALPFLRGGVANRRPTPASL